MLIISRHKDEWIDFGGGLVRICVLEIRGDKVRIGIEAPQEMKVYRQEVLDDIQQNGYRPSEKKSGSA